MIPPGFAELGQLGVELLVEARLALFVDVLEVQLEAFTNVVYSLRTGQLSADLDLAGFRLRRIGLGLIRFGLLLGFTHNSLHFALPLPFYINSILFDLLLQLEDLNLHRR